MVFGQTVEIKLVNGRNGHPLANSHVNVWLGAKQRDALALPTDQNGIAHLNLADNDGSLRINVPYVLCQPHTPDYSWLAIMTFSADEVLQKGVVRPNACGKVTEPRQPGEVTIFVRPLTWWEKFKQ